MRGSARGRFAATPLLLLGAVAALLVLLHGKPSHVDSHGLQLASPACAVTLNQLIPNLAYCLFSAAPTARAACQQCVIEFCGDFPLNMENSDNGDETCGLSKQTALLPQISLSEECTAYIKERFCKLFELQDKWSTKYGRRARVHAPPLADRVSLFAAATNATGCRASSVRTNAMYALAHARPRFLLCTCCLVLRATQSLIRLLAFALNRTWLPVCRRRRFSTARIAPPLTASARICRLLPSARQLPDAELRSASAQLTLRSLVAVLRSGVPGGSIDDGLRTSPVCCALCLLSFVPHVATISELNASPFVTTLQRR
jgi:hypothetical protein